jgi:hypothetical protein
VNIQDFLEVRWWYLLFVAVLIALRPLFRALAVVLIGKCLSPKLAELAIPLFLRPINSPRGLNKPESDSQ